MKNKGFSLVELIIVIAIMAILAAAIAPPLIRYNDKSRRADDVTAAGTVETAVVTALANEKIYDAIVGSTDSTVVAVWENKGYSFGTTDTTFQNEFKSSLPDGAAIKYKKNGAKSYTAVTTSDGQVKVYISKNQNGGKDFEIRPSRCDDYN
jgi:type IV pilus assembly protein PilA